MRKSRALGLLALIGAVALLSGCATASSSPGAGPAARIGDIDPAPPSNDVLGQGMVLDTDGGVTLCLGGVAESYPPQCAGIPVDGWSWDGVEGSETSGGTTWGSYVVRGRFDGERFALTETPILLALYDPMPLPDPTGGRPGSASEQEATDIIDTLSDRLGSRFLGAWAENGRAWVQVVWDDGSWQEAADAEFGADRVVVVSGLRELED